MLSWEKQITIAHRELPVLRTRPVRLVGDARYLNTDSQQLLNFVSNDYLGLTSDPNLIDALANAAKSYGVGSSGAPSLSGYTQEHQLLTEEMAKWLGFERCLLFNSGYQLNFSIFSQLVDKDTTIWLDKNCHASHIDGILLSRAKFITFNSANLDQVIIRIMEQTTRRHLILSEGSFSMDGSCNYWHKLIQLKQLNPDNVLLVIDDAHGIGALGDKGHGSLEQLGLDYHKVDLFIATFAKAFGSHGGFICGKAKLIDYLQQSVRSQIFSTNLPAAIAAASRASLAIINSERGYALRKSLANKISFFKKIATESGLSLGNQELNSAAIQFLPVKDIRSVNSIYNHLFCSNICVGKIVYPTVPQDSPRIRISLNVRHEEADLVRLVKQLVAATGLA